jgi:prolyl oligopeptidase
MKGQADYTRSVLDGLPLRAELLGRVKELDNAGSLVLSAQRWGGKLFYLRSDPGKDTYKLYVAGGLKGKERLLVDPEALASGDKHFSIDYFAPSRDGRLVAYGLSPSGSEMSVIHVIESATGRELPDVIDRARYASISWQPDGRSFFYKRDRKLPPDAPDTERFIKARVHLHTLGAPPDSDPAVFGYGVSPEITVPDEAFPSVYSPPSGQHVFAVVEHGVQQELTVYVARRSAVAGEKTPWKKLLDTEDEVTDFDVRGDDLYLLSHHGAPRFKIVRTSLTRPDIAHASAVVLEGDSVVRRFVVAKDALYVQQLDGGLGRLLRVPFQGGTAAPIALPVEGTVRELSAQPEEPGALFRLTSWTVSPELCVFDPKIGKVLDTGIIPPGTVDFSAITSEEVKARSADGTLVPLSIVRRKDLAKDGSHPTLLEGYGAYGVTREPAFDPMGLAWLERGGIFAVCHVRGGGEYGEDWHRGGKLLTKTSSIKDFVACAQYLVDEKLTSPARLAGEGTSAGGIVIGGAITRSPDLFAAAVIRVGMTNALRFEQIPIGPFNTSEFGTVKTREGFQVLWDIDAYHHVEPGTRYPAVLLTTGITDPRVSPWQAAKMAARLQAATASGKPVLLRVDYGSGHGIGSTKSQLEAERADKYAFLLKELGSAR